MGRRPGPAGSSSYRPDIDGLRGIAVLAVIGYHSFPEWMRGGFVGVDVFFVISGYLISGVVLNDLGRGRFSFRAFYARRVRRIFPALALVVVACLAVGWWTLLPNDFQSLGSQAAGGAAFTANVVLWREANYFDQAATLKPLLHLWSLGIEEQFYLVWPLLLVLTWRSRLRWWLLAGGLVGSFALNVAFVSGSPVATFYLPVTRAWELLVGAMLAFAAFESPAGSRFERLAGAAAWLGLVLLTLSLLVVRDDRPFPGWWALLPTVGTGLLIWSSRSWFNRRLLSSRALVGVGLISYPLYMWHWPVVSMERSLTSNPPSIGLRLLLIVAGIILAWLTYVAIERPIRFGPRRPSVVAVLGLLVAVLAVAGLAASRGLWRARSDRAEFRPIIQAIDDWDPTSAFKRVPFRRRSVLALGADATQHVLFFGDSAVEQFGPRIERLVLADSHDVQSAFMATSGGCPPVPGASELAHPQCPGFVADILDFAEDPRVDRVVIGACWGCYFAPDPGTREDRYHYYYDHDGRAEPFSADPAADPGVLESLRTTLSRLAAHKKTYLLLDIPTGPSADPRAMITRDLFGGLELAHPPELTRQMFLAKEGRVRQAIAAVAREAGVETIDPMDTFCPAAVCQTLTDDGRPLYKDSAHLRPFAVRERAVFIDETLKVP